MLFIFDTNIWISELGLNSSIGSAIRYYIKKNNAQVVVPEVIKLEVIENTTSSLNNFIQNIEKNHRQLLAIFGNLKEIVLPNEDDISEKAEFIINASGLEIREIPFDLDVAYSSFQKLIKKLPPSDKGQQFKDGVIWQHCLDLLEEDDVYFVTNDKAFFENRQLNKGLEKSLLSEVRGKENKLYIFSELSELLKEIEIQVDIEHSILQNEIEKSSGERFNSILERNGFVVNGDAKIDTTCFITEDPDIVFIEFKATYECEDIKETNRKNAFLSIKGDTSYHQISSTFENLRNFGEYLTYFDEENNVQENKNQVIHVGSAVIGHREVKHGVRYQID